jgi:hypothetical protein|eukprot:SAG25_NODE_652_length_6157_cov_9.608947_4_plen_50_part_00
MYSPSALLCAAVVRGISISVGLIQTRFRTTGAAHLRHQLERREITGDVD